MLRHKDYDDDKYIEIKDEIKTDMKMYVLEEENKNKLFTKKQLDNVSCGWKNLKKTAPDLADKYLITCLNTGQENKKVIYKFYKEWSDNPGSEDSQAKKRERLDRVFDVPFGVTRGIFYKDKSKMVNIINNIMNDIGKELYGMQSTKEDVVLFLNAKYSNPEMKGCNMAFVGPPGTGKTVMSALIAKNMNIPCQVLNSTTGKESTDFYKGFGFAYEGSHPGEFLRCLTEMGCEDGILRIEEFEKFADNPEALAHLLQFMDPQQNDKITDNYFGGVKFDFSKMLMILNMNTRPKDDAMRSRLYFIDFKGYNNTEKNKIIIDYLFPKFLKQMSLGKEQVIIDKNIANTIIDRVTYDRDEGIRALEHAVKTIVMKISYLKNSQEAECDGEKTNLSFKIRDFKLPITLTHEHIDILLKPRVFEGHLPMYG